MDKARTGSDDRLGFDEKVLKETGSLCCSSPRRRVKTQRGVHLNSLEKGKRFYLIESTSVFYEEICRDEFSNVCKFLETEVRGYDRKDDRVLL